MADETEDTPRLKRLQKAVNAQAELIAQLFGCMRHHGWNVDAYLATLAPKEPEPEVEAESLQE